MVALTWRNDISQNNGQRLPFRDSLHTQELSIDFGAGCISCQPALDFKWIGKRWSSMEVSLMSKPLNLPFIMKDVFAIAERQHELDWQFFREDVDIHWIYKDGEHGAAAALLRFKPGGKVSLHHHEGFEHILVLSGSQNDQHGHLNAGSLMIHRPGTSHSISSEEGCIVLAIYERRVSFAEQKA